MAQRPHPPESYPLLFSPLLFLHSGSHSFDRVPRSRSHSFKPIQISLSRYCGKKSPAYLSYIIISEAGGNHVKLIKLNGLSQLDRELLINRVKFFHKPIKGLRRRVSRERHDDQASHCREFDQDRVKHLSRPKRDGIRNLQSLSPSNLQSSTFAHNS
jgi:hypothetical protein